MATLTNGESATLSLDAFASVSVQCDGGVQGTLVWTSAADNLKSDLTAKLTNKTYGPYGVPGALTITVTAGSLIYTLNGTVNGLPLADGSGAAAATANTTAIQAALTAGGLVQITTPGTYYAAFPSSGTSQQACLTVYDNTQLLLGAGVVLKLAASQNRSLIRNEHYNSTIISVSSITCATANTTVGYRKGTATTSTAHGFTAGKYVLIKGDTSGGGAGTYNGIWLIDTVPSTTTFTFLFMATADGLAATGTVTAALANANIIIEGGRLDYNNVENTTVAAGTDSLMVVLNKVKNSWIRNQEGVNGLKYLWHFSNSVDCGFQNLTANTGSDVCHLKGPAWNTRFENITGQAGDDICAVVTLDVLQASINPPDAGGDIRGVFVNNITSHHSNVDRCVVIAPNDGDVISGVKIDGVHAYGIGFLAVQFTTNLNESGTVQDADVRNITGGFAGSASAIPAVNFSSGGTGTLTVGNVLIDGVKPREPSSYALVSISERVTFKEITIRNAKQRPLSLADVIQCSGANVVGEVLNIEDCRGDWDLTNAVGNVHLALIPSATVKRSRISKSRITGTGTTRTGYMYQVYAPAANARYEVVDSEADGNCSMSELSTITNSPTLYYRGIVYNATANYFQSCGQDCTVIASDIDVITSADFMIIAGTSKTVNLQMSNIRLNGQDFCTNYGTTNTINWTGGDGSCNVGMDASKFTFANGSMYYNTNAAYSAGVGLYVKGPAGPARIAP